MGIASRKVGGYLLLSGIFGGFFGAMSSDLGIVQASIITGGAVAVFGMTQLAIYLIWEGQQ